MQEVCGCRFQAGHQVALHFLLLVHQGTDLCFLLSHGVCERFPNYGQQRLFRLSGRTSVSIPLPFSSPFLDSCHQLMAWRLCLLVAAVGVQAGCLGVEELDADLFCIE